MSVNDELESLEREDEEFGSDEFNPSEFKTDNYKTEKVEELIDVNSGEVIDKSKLTPMDYIRAIAKKTGNSIKDPNPSCNKCYGRGYVNVVDPKTDQKTPSPCSCIYTKESKQAESKMPSKTNRAQRRKLDKLTEKLAIRYKKAMINKSKEEFLKKEENSNG